MKLDKLPSVGDWVEVADEVRPKEANNPRQVLHVDENGVDVGFYVAHRFYRVVSPPPGALLAAELAALEADPTRAKRDAMLRSVFCPPPREAIAAPATPAATPTPSAEYPFTWDTVPEGALVQSKSSGRIFDAEKALKPLHDKVFSSFRELRPLLEEIRMKHLKELPPELGAKELFEIARQRSWVREEAEGRLRILVP
jgi:hypothetical protein